MQQKVGPLADRAEPVIGKLGPMIDQIGLAAGKAGPVLDEIGVVAGKLAPVVDDVGMVLAATNRIVDEARPRISELSEEAAGIARSARQQVERIGELMHDAGRSRPRPAGAESTRRRQRGRAGRASGRRHEARGVRPVREVNGLAAGISAAVSTLVHHSRKPSVDQATQDEEMFI